MNMWSAPMAGLFVAGALIATPMTVTAAPLKLADPAAKVERSVTMELVHKRKRYYGKRYYRRYRNGYRNPYYYRRHYYNYPYGYSYSRPYYYGHRRHRHFYGGYGGHGFSFGFQSYR